MISAYRLQQLTELLQQGREAVFYGWPEWRQLREEVLQMDHWECQLCKNAGCFRPARIVHHVQHLRQRPDLALSVWADGDRQLLSVCKTCHEMLHPESKRQFAPSRPSLTEERWD